MLGSLKALWFLTLSAGVYGRQIPLRLPKIPEWDLNIPPNENSTDSFLFDTVNSLLQHWPNTRYRNGHSIVPGTVPVGTVLYHGTYSSEIPAVPEWLATDPEHSYLFCRGQESEGCWHHTYVATRPLKILYFDGSSAAKMQGGSMDTQDIVAWGEIRPEWTFKELDRIIDLCAWGKNFGLDGFVRMEMDFEIMYCDFKDGLHPVSKLKLVSRRRPRPPKGPEDPPNMIEDDDGRRESAVLAAGSWHNHYPGDPRIHLDLSRLFSFYDVELVPSLVACRFNKTRFAHRLEDISSEDVKSAMEAIETSLRKPEETSGIDWKGLLHVITLRYADHLEILRHHLNNTLRTPSETASLIVQELRIMLAPYILHSAVPPTSNPTSSNSWASPVFQHCATTHIDFITNRNLQLTRSELLLLSAIRGTNREICRVIVKVWAEAVAEGLDPTLQPPTSANVHTLVVMDTDEEERLKVVLDGWRVDFEGLMRWLDWSIWIKCRPACGFEEMCYLPTWPFFERHKPEEGPKDFDPSRRPGPPMWPPLGDAELFPQPRCIRRVSPYGI